MSEASTNGRNAPGFVMRPDYVIDIQRVSDRVRISLDQAVTVADTTRALRVEEQDHAIVYYIPRSDVNMNLLEPDESGSYCPFKGDAAYWRLVGGEIPVGWEYPSPYVEVADIVGHIAFYKDRLEIHVTPSDAEGNGR